MGSTLRIVSERYYRAFAEEHVSKLLKTSAGKDTVSKWMEAAGIQQRRKRKLRKVHQWRERRIDCGELVQWDTSVHNWLAGGGERLYLIAMIG